MKAIDRIYIATHKADLRLTRICVASIRHWYPAIPIFLLKDETNGSFSTTEIEDRWNVSVWPTSKTSFGWGFIKLEPLFSASSMRYLVLDADIVFIGPLLEALERFDGDFVVHGEVQPEAVMGDLYFDIHRLRAEVDPAFSSVPFTFNTGQYVATGGVLTRRDFESVLEWSIPPRVRYPDFFNGGDQGVLNYVVLKKRAEGAVTVDCAQFMKWGPECVRGLDLQAIATFSPYPALIHWAGMKKWRLSAMVRSDILRYFEREYYAVLFGGRLRLVARIVRADVHRLSRWVFRQARTFLLRLTAPLG